MSDVLCDIWDLGCHQCRQTLNAYLVMENYFSDTNMSDMQPFILYSIYLRPTFAKLFNTTINPIASLICETKLKRLTIDQPTTQPICIFVLVKYTIFMMLQSRIIFLHGFDVTSSRIPSYVLIAEANKI